MAILGFTRENKKDEMDDTTAEAKFAEAALAYGLTAKEVNLFNNIHECKSSVDELYQLALERNKKHCSA